MGIDFSNFSKDFQAKWEKAIKEDSDGGRKITKKEFDTFSPADQKKLSALISGNTQALGEIELDKDIDIKSYRTNNGEETATITTYAGKQASEGLLDLTPDTVSRYPDAYMGYLKNGVVTLYDKNGNAIKDKNGNKAKFNFTNSSDSKPTFASWYMEHNNGKFDFKTLIEMQNLDSKMKDLEYVEQDISELMHEIDMDKLKAASEDEKASFFERLDAKAAYKKAQAQDMMKEAQQMLYQASKSGELSDVASAFVTTLMANCQTIDNNVGLVKFKEFVKSVSGMNLAADKLTEAVDDGDDSNLSVGENIVENIKGFGRGVDNFIGTEAVAFLAALAGGTAIATEAGTAIASAAIGEAVSSQVVGTAIGEIVTAYFAYQGANLAYEGIKEAINAETKEQANAAGEKMGMAAFMLGGGLKMGKKVYNSGKAKIREARINKMVEKYSTKEPSTLMIELQLETNPDAQIAIKQTLRDKGYKVQDRPVDGQTQTLVYSPEGKLVASKTKSKYSDISDEELLNDFNNSSPKDIETQAELEAYAQKRQEVFHELVNERGYIPENAGAGIVIKHPSEVSTPTLLKYANLGKDHKLITTEMKNRGYVQNAEGKWVEGTKSANATEEVLEDGTKVTNQNGIKTKEFAPDGTERRFNAYGDTLEFRPDKTFVKYDSNGNVTGTDVWENIGGSRMTLSEAKHLWMGDHLGRHTLKDGILPEIERFMEANKLPSVEEVKLMDVKQIKELCKTEKGLKLAEEAGVIKSDVVTKNNCKYKVTKTSDGTIISSSLIVTRPNGVQMNLFDGIPETVLNSPTEAHFNAPMATTFKKGSGLTLIQNASKPVHAKAIPLKPTVRETMVDSNMSDIPLKYDTTFYKDTPWNPGRQEICGKTFEVTYGQLEEGWGARPEYMAEYADPATGKAPDVGTLAAGGDPVKAADKSFMPADIAGNQYDIIDPATGERIPCLYDNVQPGQDILISKRPGVELQMVVADREVISSEGEHLPAGKLYMVDSAGHPYNGDPVKRILSGEVDFHFNESDPLQADLKAKFDECKKLKAEGKKPEAQALQDKLNEEMTDFVKQKQNLQYEEPRVVTKGEAESTPPTPANAGTSPAGANGKGAEAPRTEVTSDVTSSSRPGRGELEGGESVNNIYSRITSQDGVKLDETISLPDGTTEIYKDSAGHPVLIVWKDSQGKIMNTREGVWKGSELIESTTTWADSVNTPARGDVNNIAARYENTADYSDTNPLPTGNGTRTDYEIGGKLQCTVFKDNQGKISSVLENMYDESGNLVKTVETKADGTSVTKAESNPPSSLRDTSTAGVNNSVAENPSPQPSPAVREGAAQQEQQPVTSRYGTEIKLKKPKPYYVKDIIEKYEALGAREDKALIPKTDGTGSRTYYKIDGKDVLRVERDDNGNIEKIFEYVYEDNKLTKFIQTNPDGSKIEHKVNVVL